MIAFEMMKLDDKELDAEWNRNMFKRKQGGFGTQMSPMWEEDEASPTRRKLDKESKRDYFQAKPAEQKSSATQPHPRQEYQELALEGPIGPTVGPRAGDSVNRAGNLTPKTLQGEAADTEGEKSLRKGHKEKEQQRPQATVAGGPGETTNSFPGSTMGAKKQDPARGAEPTRDKPVN